MRYYGVPVQTKIQANTLLLQGNELSASNIIKAVKKQRRYITLEKETKEYLKACEAKSIVNQTNIKALNDYVINRKTRSLNTTFLANSPVILDGLVLWLDAGVSDSYPAGGTVWRDLASSNNGTLTNGPTFSSGNGGAIVFDGTDDYVNLNTVYNPGTTGNITLDVWGFFTGPFSSYPFEPPTTNLAGVIGQGYFGNYVGYGIGISVQSGNIYSANFQVRSGGNFINSSAVLSINTWFNIVGVLDRTNTNLSYIYLNGILAFSTSCASLIGVNLNPNISEFRIGANTFPFYCGCRVGSGKLYNRALTSSEILQNYNAIKGRFSL